MARSIVRKSIVFFAVLFALNTPAFAHPEWSPIRVNRYLKLSIAEGEPPAIVYTLLYGDGPALAARKSVDADANGKVDATEKAVLGAHAAAAIGAGLKIEIDGVAEALRPANVDVGLAGDEVTTQPFSVDVRYELVRLAAAGKHTLHIDDRVDVPNEGDSEVSIAPPNAHALVAAYRGVQPPANARGADTLFTFRGPRFSALEDRTVTIVVDNGAGAAGPASTRGLPSWTVIIGVAALALAAYLAIRRTR